MEDANNLVEFSKENDIGGFEFTILKELEVERDQFFGKTSYGDRRGGSGGGGGGRFSRERDSGRGRDYEPRVFRGSSGSGGSRFAGKDGLKVRTSYRSNEGNYHGGNQQRSDHEYRPSRSSNSRSDGSSFRKSNGSSDGGLRTRRYSSERSNTDNDGW